MHEANEITTIEVPALRRVVTLGVGESIEIRGDVRSIVRVIEFPKGRGQRVVIEVVTPVRD